MPKRTARDSEFEVDANDDSGAEWADNPRPSQPKLSKRSKTQPQRKKTRVNNTKQGTTLVSEGFLVEADASPHPKARHTIASAEEIRAALLKWYSNVYDARGMPWRKQFDPSLGPQERSQRAYEVWVSEIMLQQTQVATVIPYYNRWMEKFPTLSDLAAATVDEVNALWKGLGYYSRASRLLSGAQKTVQQYGGKLPDNAKDMEASIPGIGRYSAGAICSIAYGERVPVLDGNVNRLLSRLLALYAPPKAKTTLDTLWEAATVMVQESDADDGNTTVEMTSIERAQHSGDINQALIELGSTVCRVRDPLCNSCPLKQWCTAYSMAQNLPSSVVEDIEDICKLCVPLPLSGDVTIFPMKAEKKKAREELDVVNVVEWRSSDNSQRWFLVIKRPESGLLAGLYDFPTREDVAASISDSALHEIPLGLLAGFLQPSVLPLDNSVRSLADNLDSSLHEAEAAKLRVKKIVPVGDVLHVFSHIKKTYRVQWVLLGGGDQPPAVRPDVSDDNIAVSGQVARGSSQKGKSKKKGRNIGSQKSGCMWVPLLEVANLNIGTGVVKVWDLVSRCWDDEARR